jgi:hypothetical protein
MVIAREYVVLSCLRLLCILSVRYSPQQDTISGTSVSWSNVRGSYRSADGPIWGSNNVIGLTWYYCVDNAVLSLEKGTSSNGRVEEDPRSTGESLIFPY